MSYDDNRQLGFFKCFRSIIDWEWFKDANTLQVWIYCLAKANHKDKKYKGNLIKRGSFYTSYEKISQETGLSVRQIRTALNHLKSTNELTNATSPKGSIISIKNYDLYQDTTSTLTVNRQTTDKQPTTNKKYKNIKNSSSSDSIATPTTTQPSFSDDFNRFWQAYLKKGSKKDTYEEWCSHDFSEEDVELIVFAAGEYSKEMEDDRRTMVYSRTFIENEMYLDYMKPYREYQAYLEDQEEIRRLYGSKKGG